MKKTRVLTALFAAIALSSTGLVAASADVNPGAFEVTMDSSSQQDMGMEPDCTPAMSEIPAKMMAGGAFDMTCKIQMDDDVEMNGKVSNQSMATEFGSDAFLDGVLTSKCHMIQDMEMVMAFGGGMSRPTMKRMSGAMFQQCAWKMVWQDPKNTTLSGTMEMNGKAGNDDGSVAESGDVQTTMTMKMYVTEGTGEYEGYVGTGEFTRSQSMPTGAGGSSSGGSQSGPPSGGAPSGGAPSGGSGGAPSGASLAAICQQLGISNCTMENVQAACQANPSACGGMSPLRMAKAMKRFALKTVSSMQLRAGAEDGMSMKLVKAAGQVRILSPAAPAGQPNAPAAVTAKSKVEIVATSGAKCLVKSNRGKKLGAKTSTSSSAATVLSAKGGYKGVTWIQATCSLDGKTFKSNKVKVKL